MNIIVSPVNYQILVYILEDVWHKFRESPLLLSPKQIFNELYIPVKIFLFLTAVHLSKQRCNILLTIADHFDLSFDVLTAWV